MKCPINKDESECPCREYAKQGSCDYPYKNGTPPQIITELVRLGVLVVALALMTFSGWLIASPARASSWDTVDGAIRFIYTEVERPCDLEDWSDLAELEAFLEKHGDERVIVVRAGRDGEISFDGQCVAYAIALRDLAEEYGKNIEVMGLSKREYRRVFGRGYDGNDNHAVCMAVVGDSELYYIDIGDYVVMPGGYIP